MNIQTDKKSDSEALRPVIQNYISGVQKNFGIVTEETEEGGGDEEELQYVDIPITWGNSQYDNSSELGLRFGSIITNNEYNVLEYQRGWIYTKDVIDDTHNVKKVEFISSHVCGVYGVAYAKPADGGPSGDVLDINILCYRNIMNTQGVPDNVMYTIRLYY